MTSILEKVLAIFHAEPVVVIGLVTAGVVALAGNFGIVLDKVSVEAVLAPIVAAVLGRQFVKPVAAGD